MLFKRFHLDVVVPTLGGFILVPAGGKLYRRVVSVNSFSRILYFNVCA